MHSPDTVSSDVFNNLTICMGLDAATLPLARLSLPTWRLHREEMWDRPWFVFYDEAVSDGVRELCNVLDLPAKICCWNPTPDVEYETQRGKMLAGWALCPARQVATDYWMKIDADVVCTGPGEWLLDSWFDPVRVEGTKATTMKPVLVAPRWGYTKAKGGHGTIHDWARQLEAFSESIGNHISLMRSIRDGKLRIARWCSWVSYYSTAWSREIADTCETLYGPGGLPVPSQDTTYWMAALSRQDAIRLASPKRRNWQTIPSASRLAESAGRILAGSW